MYSSRVKLDTTRTLAGRRQAGKRDANQLTPLYDKHIFPLASLGLEEVMFLELDTICQAFGVYERLSRFTSHREILNNEVLDIRIPGITSLEM